MLTNSETSKIPKKIKIGRNFLQFSLIGLKRYLKKRIDKLNVKITSYK